MNLPWRLLALAALLPAASPASAKPARAPAKKDAAARKAPAVPEELRAKARPASAAELVAHFQRLDDKLASLSCRFTQTLTLGAAGISQRVEGSVDYLKPSRLRVRHRKPEPQDIVVDGSSIWIHRKQHNQVIEAKLEDWRKADPLLGSLLDLGRYSELLRKYRVDFDTASLTAELRPPEGEEPFVLRLQLSGPALFPERSALEVGEMRVETSFRDLRLNPELPPSLFAFAPPPGAELLKGFKPPSLRREGAE